MRRSPKLKPVVWDGAVVLIVISLAIVCGATFWGRKTPVDALTVVVSVDGNETDRFLMEEMPDGAETVYSNNGYTLRVRRGTSDQPEVLCIRVTESNCPTQDCVHTGEISRAGQSIVCLPARIIIQLEGESPDSDGPDIVIG